MCRLQEPPQSHALVIPLRLKGEASAVYRPLAETHRKDIDKLKDSLKGVFAVDEYAAYEGLSSRHLRPGERVDVFLAELQHLATLFGLMSDEGLGCAFLAGLPISTRQILPSRSEHGVSKTLRGGGQGSRHFSGGKCCIKGGSRACQRCTRWPGWRSDHQQ